MKANKEKSVEISARVLKSTPEIISRAYDEQIGMLQDRTENSIRKRSRRSKNP